MRPFFILILFLSLPATANQPATETRIVTYEDFGAMGDGKTDDLPAIQKAHEHANKHNLPVRSRPNATYHLGRRAITAIIATNTDWNSSHFIIDDSKGVENHQRPLFEVRSLLEPIPLQIDRLSAGQTHLDLRPTVDCLVYVENNKHRIYIRRGLNQNRGTTQKEVFILRRNGSIEGSINWDYDAITRITAQPIEAETLFLRGGVFTNIANRMKPDQPSNYWSRNIQITRSRTVVENLTQKVTGEMEHGHPYSGFLNARQSAMIVFRNCVVDGRKTYRKIGNADKSVSMGTYGYQANLIVDFRMINCRTGTDIHDRSRWGVVATNFMKNMLIEDCTLSRVDVHMGISGTYHIRRSTLGHAGLNAIGSGRLIVEESTIHGNYLVNFRSDYGSTWHGEIVIRDSRWIPAPERSSTPVMFNMNNDGWHDFGYPCSMPRLISIDRLFVDDSKRPASYRGINLFGNPIGSSPNNRPFPYHLTEKIKIRDLKTASGNLPQISTNPEITKAVTIQPASAVRP